MPAEIETVQTEIRDNAYWPGEALLTDFAEQDTRAEKDDRMEQADRTIENNPEYATLYFVS